MHFKASFSGRTLFSVLVLSLAPVCLAQDQPAQPDFEHEKDAAAAAAKPRGVGQLHRDFGFPGAIRPWERGMYLNPRRSTYGYSYPSVYGPYYGGAYGGYYRPYGLRPQHNRVYRESYGPPYEAYSLPLDHAYDLGVAPPEIQDTIAAQAERALTDYQSAMDAGYGAFTMIGPVDPMGMSTKWTEVVVPGAMSTVWSSGR